MKHTAKRLLMSCLSMLLVLSLVLSLSPAILAAGPATSGVKDVNGDGKITYVSFGDSVTNGYGMDGYRYEDGTNVLGFRREVEDAYPAMIAKALGADLEQMAISGFRMDELHWMLDDDYVADSYHTSAFENWNRKAVQRLIQKDEAFAAKYKSQFDGTTASADKIIMTEYRNAVKNADLITIDLGTNNFGTFVTNTIQEILGLKELDYEVDFTQYMDAKTAASLEAMLGQMVAQLVGASSGNSYDLAMTLARCLMYGYLGYTEHYDGAIEAIYELNPKAQVVVIDCYTMITGVDLEGGALGENLDLDELYDMFIDLANFYARELSPYANKVTHATLSTAPALFIDYYKDYETNKANGTYADTQYLYPTAERLMNEFVMEAMTNPETGEKYDVDTPADHTAFQKNVLDNIELLDSYVNNLQATVKENVIDAKVVPGIKDGVQTAVDGVDTAIEGVELVNKAVDAVALADSIVTDIIVGTVLENTMGRNPSMFKSTIIRTAEDTLADPEYDYLEEYGTDEELANLVYEISVLYYETNEESGEAEARKVSILAILEFVLESEEQANLAYTVAEIYNNELEATGSEESAMLAALKTQVSEDDAKLAMQVYAIYTQNGGGTDDEAANSAARDATIVTMIKTQYSQEGLAEAMYAVYCGNATAEQQQLAYIAAMVSAGIDEAVATAIYTCYATNLDGQYNNENVETTMIYFMTQVLEDVDTEEAADLYDSYLVYKNLPTTLCKIAKCDTIYFDALLEATENGLNMDAVAAEFMAGTLNLDEPAADASEEEWEAYKADSAMATLYFRFMSQDGVFTHPSEAGQKTLYNAAQGVLNSLLVAEADRDIVITEETNLLVLGDFIAANDDGYVETLGENLGIKPTNLSVADFRINDVRALLDSSYQADAYAKAVTASVTTDYKAAVRNSDVILLHLGSMNMGLIAKQLETYMKDGSTYSMQFSTVDNMKTQNLGAAMDAFLNKFAGVFSADEVGALMLSFETYGYGYTTFADCLDNTVETIQDLNPDADIVLVGMYDLLGDAYISDGNGVYLEMGAFVGHAVNLMNQHMQTYAAMTDNVTYVDVSDTESVMAAKGAVNMMEGGVDGIAAAFTSALPTADGYDYMTAQISCALGGHTLDGDITWNWASDCSSATASFHCSSCGKDVALNASVAVEKSVSCTEKGEAAYTATVSIGGNTYTDVQTRELEATGHTVETIPGKAATCSETGLTDGSKCSVCGETLKEQEVIEKTAHTPETIPGKAATCTEDGLTEGSRCSVCDEILTAQNVIEATGHTPETLAEKDPTCTETGLTEGSKCSVCDEILEAQEEIPALGHNWDDGVVTKEATETETGVITYTCKDCGETKTETIPELNHTHSYTAVVTDPTCTEKGYTTYTCSCGDSYMDNEIDALGHKFDKGVCTVCGYSEVTVNRVYGKDRYKTAYAVAEELKALMEVETFDNIIVACGTNFPDALAGSYLSTELEAPILLTDTKVDSDVLAYIEENLTEGGKVYILGGDAAVSQEFEDSLEKTGIEVERLSGKDRYATNLAILNEAGLNGKEILVCTGDNYADSLSASAVNLPILLVNTKTNELTTAQEEYLEALGDDYTFYIVGGEGAVSKELEDAIAEYGKVDRVYGKDREATSVEVAKKFFETPDTVALAYSRNFPDGLCGGLLAYKLNAPMLLVDAKTETYAEDYVAKGGIKKGVVLGGSGVVSDEIIRTVFDLDEDFEIK